MLEENFVFYEHEDAKNYQSFLQENGCTATILPIPCYTTECIFKGSIGEFSDLVELIKAEVDDYADEELQKDVKESLKDLERFVTRNKQEIQKFYHKNPIGSIVSMPETKPLSEYTDMKEVKKSSELFYIIDLLKDNGVLSQTDNERQFKLIIQKPVSDIILSHNEYGFDSINEDLLYTAGLITTKETCLEYLYLLKTDLQIVRIDPALHLDYIGNEFATNIYDIKEDPYDVIERLRSKRSIIRQITKAVSSGIIEPAKIAEELKKPTIFEDSEYDEECYHVNADCLADFIADMKSLGILSETGGKLCLGKKPLL